MYLIIEVCNREVASIHAAKDLPSAAAKSNELLDEHLETIGMDKDGSYEWNKMQRADPEGGEQSAWCNLKDMHWDAHVAYAGESAEKSMLDALLKELCKKAMDAPGSGCGDGSCEDCAVNTVLGMASD